MVRKNSYPVQFQYIYNTFQKITAAKDPHVDIFEILFN